MEVFLSVRTREREKREKRREKGDAFGNLLSLYGSKKRGEGRVGAEKRVSYSRLSKYQIVETHTPMIANISGHIAGPTFSCIDTSSHKASTSMGTKKSYKTTFFTDTT